MADFNRQRDEAFTEQHFSQMDRVTQDGGARMLLCFCIDISRSMSFVYFIILFSLSYKNDFLSSRHN